MSLKDGIVELERACVLRVVSFSEGINLDVDFCCLLLSLLPTFDFSRRQLGTQKPSVLHKEEERRRDFTQERGE